MVSNKNIVINGSNNLPIALDIFFKDNTKPKSVVIYAHGFNGFKDWGNGDLIAQRFAQAGYVFVKFNFSHNGTSPDAPEDFVNLNAFAENNYSKQLEDVQKIVDWVYDENNSFHLNINTQQIALIGHSMGGGIAILYASKDDRIKALITWASISECKTPWGNWSAEKIAEWKSTGVQYYLNGRTQQQMPLHYQLYQDYINNAEAYDIKKAMAKLIIPVLICHGTEDPAVAVENAYALKAAQPAAQLFTLNTDHVFGRKHPWPSNDIPAQMEMVLQESIDFLEHEMKDGLGV